jgi:hypothetical protein
MTDDSDPTKQELLDRVEQLESTVEKMLPSRREALKLGAAGAASVGGVSLLSDSADASTGSAGQIGDPSNRPDLFADTVDAKNFVGLSAGTALESTDSITTHTINLVNSGSFKAVYSGSSTVVIGGNVHSSGFVDIKYEFADGNTITTSKGTASGEDSSSDEYEVMGFPPAKDVVEVSVTGSRMGAVVYTLD